MNSKIFLEFVRRCNSFMLIGSVAFFVVPIYLLGKSGSEEANLYKMFILMLGPLFLILMGIIVYIAESGSKPESSPKRADLRDDTLQRAIRHFFDALSSVRMEKFDMEATYQFVITGNGGGEWNVRVLNGKSIVAMGTSKHPSIVLTTRVEDFFELINGNLKVQSAFLSGKLKVQGDMTLAVTLESIFGFVSHADRGPFGTRGSSHANQEDPFHEEAANDANSSHSDSKTSDVKRSPEDLEWCFQILGIGSTPSLEDIDRAYRAKAKIHHPDKGGDSDAMKTLNLAREHLKRFAVRHL